MLKNCYYAFSSLNFFNDYSSETKGYPCMNELYECNIP